MPTLRPVFTDLIIKELGKYSLNIYAPRGQGQLRLLKDLETQLLDRGNIVFLVQMKSYAESYQGFIQALAVQTVQQIPLTQSASLTHFADLVAAWDKRTAQQHIVVMLHDFDMLLDNPQIDEAYGTEFFDHLNALKNQSHRLICMTEQPHNQSQVYVNQKVHSNSWLDLNRIELPSLTYDEIKHELFPHKYQLSHADENLLIDTIKQHTQSYQFLDFIRQKLALKDAKKSPLNLRLKKWRKEFVQREKSTVFKGLHNVSKWTTRIAIVTGVNQLKTPFVLIINIIQKIAGKAS